MKEDWDYLIVLDACRFDIFEDVNTIQGDLDHSVSIASKTPEFVDETFKNKELHDTVYVTMNPHAEDLNSDNPVFYKIIKLYDTSRDARHDIAHKEGNEGMERVRRSAIEASEKFPNKRLIIHFMPPHYPALGSRADEMRDKLRAEFDIEFRQIRRMRGNEQVLRDSNPSEVVGNLRHAAQKNYISFDEAKEAYVENLELVLDQVDKLLAELEGKAVVTGDHGELIGEKTVYTPTPTKGGHHEEIYVPELRVVPWLVIESDERPEIITEQPVENDMVADEVVNERLRSLGYK